MSDSAQARRWWPLGVAALYFVFGLAWIWLSDRALLALTRDPDAIMRVENIKGVLFVFVSTVIIGLLEYGHRSGKRYRNTILGELRAREEHLEIILNSSRDLIVLADDEGRCVYVSPGARENLGYAAEAMQGRRLVEFAVAEDREHFVGAEKSFICRFDDARGERRWLSVTCGAATLRGAQHRTYVLRDVSGSQRAQHALLREKQLVDAVVNSMPGIFYLFDAAGERLLRWNRNLETVTGYSAEELRALAPWQLTGADATTVARLANAVFTRGVISNEGRLICKDGRRLPYLFTGHFMELEGEPFVVGVGLDISRVREAELQLARSVARFREVFEASPAGIALLDQAARIKEANPAFCRLLRCEPEDLHGEDLARFVEPLHRAALTARLRDAASSGADVEIEMLRSDGKRLNVILVCATLFTGNGEHQYMVIAEDETLRRAYERRLEQYAATLEQLSRRQLELLEQERREISRELHDEVGQLLTAIRLRINNALATDEREARMKQLRDAGDETGRVLDVVRQLSRTLRPTILDDFGLAAALQWLSDSMLNALVERPKLALDTEELSPRPDPLIETACFRIAQEALTNVVKYARASRVEVILATHDDGVTLEVNDDGIGFDVDAAEAAAARGQSLGVLGMRERAVLAGGRLEIRSRPNEGTQVRAWLPRRPHRNLPETGAGA